MKFKNLITKKKSELVDIAKDKGIDSPNQIKKNNLIKKLGDLSDIEKEVLSWKSTTIRDKCGELGLSYKNVADSSIDLVNKLQDKDSEPDNVEREFQKAIRLALNYVKKENRSYHVLQKVNQENYFLVQPMFMKVDKNNYKLKMTIIYYDE